MPIRDTEKRREYARRWYGKRRREWLAANGPCVRCGSWERLELDHIEPTQKIDHKVWHWTRDRRLVELAKCQVLCHKCHKEKTREQLMSKAPCGTRARYQRGCRCEPCRDANRDYAEVRRSRPPAPLSITRAKDAEDEHVAWLREHFAERLAKVIAATPAPRAAPDGAA